MNDGPLTIKQTLSDEIPAGSGFQLVKRGYDPVEVQAFAKAVSAELQRLSDENRRLKATIAETEAQPAHIDEQSVAQFLGKETSRLLDVARTTSADVVARAEGKAAAIVEEAHKRSDTIKQEAQNEAAKVRLEAKEEARTAQSTATGIRQQTLLGLAARRDLANAQLEELAECRDQVTQRLAEVGEITRELLAKLGPIQAERVDFVNLDIDLDDNELVMDSKAVLKLTSNGKV